ncbi:MAG: DUF6017 domain-containing protein [Ethanoligenens sp.]
MSDMPAPAADVRAGFFRLPKVLFLDERYRGLSTDAKVLYALMLDHMGLSIRNGWADRAGRVFIYFTLDEIRKLLGCGHGKATGLCRELEVAALIERGPQVKKGRPQPIYVRDFACVYGKPAAQEPEKAPEKPEPADSHNAENRQREPETAKLSPRFPQTFPHEPDDSGKAAPPMPEIGGADAENRQRGCRKPAASYTDFNKTDLSYTDPSIVLFPRGTPPADGIDRADVLQTIRENISYDILLLKRPDEKSRIDGIVSLLTDTVCSRRPYLRISGEDIPIGDVRERLLSLDDGHIEYVFDCMDENTVPIGNIRAYLLTALYNAPLTIDSYYDARVRRDMALESEKRANIWTA